jgi:cation transport protein ChaC
MSDDPFRHHPALRDLITPPEQSRLRDLTPEMVRELSREHGLRTDTILPDEERDACRARTMEGRWKNDLWIFGYGSLMWDPGLVFAELRRARAPGLERRFILVDENGARGMPGRPGVMAALDTGSGCDGLIFRIAGHLVDDETRRLWNRERIEPGYHSAFVTVETAIGPIEALTFLADHDAQQIHPDLSHEDQVRFCATGEGILGTSRDYLESLARGLSALGIDDPHVTSFLEDVRTYRE